MIQPSLPLIVTAVIAIASPSFAAVDIATESSTGTPFASTPWFGNMSATDLVNAGQTTLSLATITTPFFGPNGTNDGLAGPNNTTQNTYLSSGADLANSFTEAEGKSWATYDLDVSVNTLGYDITSIESFMGWQANSELHANQTYSVEVSTVGSGSYLALTSVSYVPFTSVNGTDHESHVTITEDATGILATGVDSIRFKFDNPGGGAGSADGTVIREIDIHGVPTATGSGGLSLEVLGFGISAAGSFDLTVGGLDLLKSYVLRRSQTLMPGSWTDVDSSFTPTSSSQMVSDPAPLTGAAFYRVEESP